MKHFTIYRLFLFTLLFSFFFSNNLNGQEIPKPSYWGIFIVSNGELIELRDADAVDLIMKGNLMQAVMGIRTMASSPFISDPSLYFIVYGNKLNPMRGQNPVLSRLIWSSSLEMYVAGSDINLNIGPVEGIENAFRLVPQNELNEGMYSFHSGRLNATDPFSGTIEANQQNDVWTFYISKELMGTGALSSVDLSKGQYTIPPAPGLFLISNNRYIQVPVSKRRDAEDFLQNEERLKGMKEISDIRINSKEMLNWMVARQEEDLRTVTINVQARVVRGDHLDFIPERMVLSKLKKETVDIRSRRDIRRNNPEELMELWVPYKTIPFNFSRSGLEGRIGRIVLSQKLEPGVYALHNEVLTSSGRSFGTMDIVYTFTVTD